MGDVRAMVDNMIREIGPARQFILQDAGDYWSKQASKHVHKITKKTLHSITSSVSGGNKVNLEASWGAPFEEDRGPPHDFMTQALEDLVIAMPNIVDNRMNKIFGGGIHR